MASYVQCPRVDLGSAATVFEPPAGGEGCWVGAPCVHSHDGQTYLAVRWRLPELRGHTVTIYERRGVSEYAPVTKVEAATLGAQSLERPALLTDPDTGQLKLYLSVEHGENEWTIQKLDDVDDPAAFDAATARDVLEPTPGTTDAATVKDPTIVTHEGRYYMFYAGHDGEREQAHLATSDDGERWTPVPENPVLESGGWHDFYTRISCVLPAPDSDSWLVYYEGSNRADYRPVRNLRTGVAVSDDLRTIEDCSPDAPELSALTEDERIGVSSYATVRYLDALQHPDGVEWFFEIARPDGALELRRTREAYE